MIKQLCDEHKIPWRYTSKLFFDHFTTSLTVNFPQDIADDYKEKSANIRSRIHLILSATSYGKMSQSHSDAAHYSDALDELRLCSIAAKEKRNRHVGDIIRRFPDELSRDGSDFRINKVSVTFYFDDPLVLQNLIGKLPNIIKVSIPRNEEEIAFLRTNTNKIIRDKHFFDHYAFRVLFKLGTTKQLEQYVETQFCEVIDGIPQIDSTRAYFFSTTNPILYLSDFSDVVITKIGVQDIIQKIEQIVLRK